MRYLIKLSYDGSGFVGYQSQPNLRTVQTELEKALTRINDEKKVIVFASGRTDKGVHAMEQYIHCDVDVSITPKKLKRAMNTYLPKDIHIIEVLEVDSKFHARYHVHSKEYKYLLNMGEFNPIERNYVFQYNYKLDVDKMRDAIKYFVGEHDFRAFVTENKDKSNCVRTIIEASIEEIDKKLTFSFKGTGFLRYQVRNMIGILIKVGEGRIDSSVVKEILDSKDRSKNGVTAPPEGLYLIRVNYNGELYERKKEN